MEKIIYTLCLALLCSLAASNSLNAQLPFSGGQVSGSFQIEAQTYKSDSVMQAPKVDEQIQSMGFFNLNYVSGGFTAGMRYEYYLNPLLGIDDKYKGQGIPFYFFTYSNDLLDVTAGDFYGQFGSGMIFRAYEERALGYDNAVNGANIRIRPVKGMELTALIGKQRNYWDLGEGIVRGGDLNMLFNEMFSCSPETMNIFGGASLISLYQPDNDLFLKMPANVLAWSGRAGVSSANISADIEYSYKYNDPNATNGYNYNAGYGMLLNAAYFNKGISASLNLHKIDNMDFRSDRYATGTQLMINYIPALTKQHTYRLASMYPYATQYNGEAGIQAEMSCKLPRNSSLGGKYGTDITLNYSRVQSIDTTHTMNDDGKYSRTYDSPLFGIGDELFFQDINATVYRKFSDFFKGTLAYMNIIYNKDVLENSGAPNSGKVYANVLVLDGTFRLNKNLALKGEVQHLWSKQDSAITDHDVNNGNWLGLTAELTIGGGALSGLYLTIYDDWNYGNEIEDRQIHYLNANVAYTVGASRFSFGYGRQRSGILCVGGVCRQVPASNGLYLSASLSF